MAQTSSIVRPNLAKALIFNEALDANDSVNAVAMPVYRSAWLTQIASGYLRWEQKL